MLLFEIEESDQLGQEEEEGRNGKRNNKINKSCTQLHKKIILVIQNCNKKQMVTNRLITVA